MRYSVLTYIFGNYEHLHEIIEKDPDAEYVCVTDQKELTSNTWKIIYNELSEYKTGFDKSFYVRYNPFKFVNTEIVIKVDGSIIIKKPMSPIIDVFDQKNCDLCLMIHPERNTLSEEYLKWINYRKYSLDAVQKASDMIASDNYFMNYKGLYQLTFSIQRNTIENSLLNEMTYAFIKYLGNGHVDRLDQTIFSYILNRYFPNHFDNKILPVSESLITNSKYMTWCLHDSDESIQDKENKIKPYLFNKEISTVDF